MIKIWVDDERPMPDSYDIACMTVYETIAEIAWWLSKGKDVLIDLDHDAGDMYRETGGGDYINILKAYVAGWGECMCHMQNVKLKVRFHSANPVGVKNMRTIVKNCPWMVEVKDA